MKKCVNMTVEETSVKGRRTTWLKTAQNNMKLKQIKEEDRGKRNKCRTDIKI